MSVPAPYTPSSHQLLQPPSHTHPQCTPRGIQDGKKQEAVCAMDAGPRWLRCIHCIYEIIPTSPDSYCTSSHTQKSTEIIHLRFCFVCVCVWLIFWCSTTCFLGFYLLFVFLSHEKLLFILTLPLPFWNSSSELSERMSARLQSSLRFPNKT